MDAAVMLGNGPVSMLRELFGPMLDALPVALVVVFFGLLLRWLLGFWREKWTYRARAGVFTPTEQAFLHILEEEVPDTVWILGKVRLADLIEPDGARTRKGWFGAFNRISSKHVDFVLCDPVTSEVIGVIELDDSTHQRADRVARDEFVDAALDQAGIPILHVPVAKTYDRKELRRTIAKILMHRTQQ